MKKLKEKKRRDGRKTWPTASREKCIVYSLLLSKIQVSTVWKCQHPLENANWVKIRWLQHLCKCSHIYKLLLHKLLTNQSKHNIFYMYIYISICHYRKKQPGSLSLVCCTCEGGMEQRNLTKLDETGVEVLCCGWAGSMAWQQKIHIARN